MEFRLFSTLKRALFREKVTICCIHGHISKIQFVLKYPFFSRQNAQQFASVQMCEVTPQVIPKKSDRHELGKDERRFFYWPHYCILTTHISDTVSTPYLTRTNTLQHISDIYKKTTLLDDKIFIFAAILFCHL